MVQANQADLLGQGVFDSQDPNDPDSRPNPNNPGGISNNELARLLRRQRQTQRQGNPTQGYGGSSQQIDAARSANRANVKTADAPNNLLGDIGTIWGSDPVTTTVLAAPYAVVGGGLLAGGGTLAGAGAGGGAVGGGTLAPATATPTLSSVGTMASPFGPGAGAPTLGAVGTVPSPFYAGAAGGGALPAMAGGAGAAGGLSVSDMIGLGGLGVSAGSLIASQIQTGAEKDLVKKQEELAAAAKQRRSEAEQERLNRLGQQLLAFNPLNQAMARMYGPEAAFTPEQMSGLAGDPGAKTREDYERARSDAYAESLRTGKPIGAMQGFSGDDMARMEADERRRAQVQSAFQRPPPGPAPMRMPTPQAARRF